VAAGSSITPMTRRSLLFAAAALFLLLAAWLAPAIAFHVLPLGWTGEADRLAAALGIGPGSVVAEIGAGSGEMAVEIAARLGPDGRLYATELTPEKRQAIAERAARLGAGAIQVLEAGERDPALPAACCDAIFMRNVLHHIDDWSTYIPALAAPLRPGGRVGIIDFSPKALFHLAGDHGAEPDRVSAAFQAAGFVQVARIDDWGGRMYLLVFTRQGAGPGGAGIHSE
jgi:SAM-dependent methyltransferase